MYRLVKYELIKTTPLSSLTKRDLVALGQAVSAAENSVFTVNHRVGACLEKGQCLLCG